MKTITAVIAMLLEGVFWLCVVIGVVAAAYNYNDSETAIGIVVVSAIVGALAWVISFGFAKVTAGMMQHELNVAAASQTAKEEKKRNNQPEQDLRREDLVMPSKHYVPSEPVQHNMEVQSKVGDASKTNHRPKRAPAHTKVIDEQTIDPKAALILEYDDAAQEAYEQLNVMGNEFGQSFLERLVSDPSADIEKLKEETLADSMPFEDDELNDLYSLLSEAGHVAQNEFKETIELVGKRVDAHDVFRKTYKKYASKRPKHMNQSYRPQTDKKTQSEPPVRDADRSFIDTPLRLAIALAIFFVIVGVVITAVGWSSRTIFDGIIRFVRNLWELGFDAI